MTKEEFNKMIEVGDIVTIIGLKEPVDCVVMTKTEYACNLFTVEQGNTADGIMRPSASYYRSYGHQPVTLKTSRFGSESSNARRTRSGD